MFNLKRDPVVLANLVGSVVMGLLDWFTAWNDEQTALANGVVLAVVNLVAAALVHDGQVVALSGLGKAVLALVAGFGLSLNPDLQVAVMAALAWAGSLWVREKVSPKGAPTPPALAEPVVEVNNAVGQVGTFTPDRAPRL